MVKYLYKINAFKYLFILLFITAVVSSFLIELISPTLFFDYNIPIRVTMFIIWQSLIIIPILCLMNKDNLLNRTERKNTLQQNV